MLKLNLKEIPLEGRSYRYTRSTGEINGELQDLIGNRDYTIDFTIRPTGNIFELSGTLQTGVEAICAQCGWDLIVPLARRFTDYLVADGEYPRGSKAVHGNQSLDLETDGPDYTFYQGEHFCVGEYFHEMIALSEPDYPSCGIENCEHKAEVQEILGSLEQSGATAEERESAFAVLKTLKIDSSGSGH